MHQVDENENVSLQPLQPLNFELKITDYYQIKSYPRRRRKIHVLRSCERQQQSKFNTTK